MKELLLDIFEDKRLDKNRNTGTKRSVTDDWGKFTIHHILETPHLKIREYTIRAEKDIILQNKQKEDKQVEISIIFHPVSIIEPQQQKRHLLHKNLVYVIHKPIDTIAEISLTAGDLYRSIHFYIPASFFYECLPQEQLVNNFLQSIKQNQYALLFDYGYEIDTKINETIHALHNVETTSDLYINLKYKSLLYNILAILCTINKDDKIPVQNIEYPFKASDIQKIHDVKNFITLHTEQFYTIEQLAKQFSINLFKLKKGFKTLFGTGIFEYTTKIRMDNALQLIQNSDLSLKEIAFKVGYSAPSSFTVAFKKTFGKVPRDYKPNFIQL